MRVLVAGATGAIGVPLVDALLAHGHSVIAITRQPRLAEENRHRWSDALVADVLDRDALLAAGGSVRADAVINQLTALPGLPSRYRDLTATNELRVRGTENLIALAQATGASRLVTQSFLTGYGYGDHGLGAIDERQRFGPPGRNPGLEAIIAALRSAEDQTFHTPGLTGIALRYGLFYGPGGPLELMVKMLRRRSFPVVRAGDGTLSYVYLPDAAAATVAALEHGRGGEAYNIGDDEPVRWSTFITAVAETFELPRPLRVPGWFFRALPMAYALMHSTIGLSNAKAKSELGWTPAAPTYREGLADARHRLGQPT
ncbi:MAG: NAD(P)-dependent oxidoreductase [Propionibacteriaceae bacterium]